jgi:hypothetical protein
MTIRSGAKGWQLRGFGWRAILEAAKTDLRSPWAKEGYSNFKSKSDV